MVSGKVVSGAAPMAKLLWIGGSLLAFNVVGRDVPEAKGGGTERVSGERRRKRGGRGALTTRYRAGSRPIAGGGCTCA